MSNVQLLLLQLPVLIFSVVLHEYAHAWQARREGDNTATMLGRLTLNPLPHIDPIGSVLLPALLAAAGAPVLGWARPVPTNPRNYRNFRAGDIRVSLAGISANLALAVALIPLVALAGWAAQVAGPVEPSFRLLQQMFAVGIFINLLLAFFNLLPIPPLDGSHVMYHLLPPAAGARYRQLGVYGTFILLALMYLNLLSFLRFPVQWLTEKALDVARLLGA